MKFSAVALTLALVAACSSPAVEPMQASPPAGPGAEPGSPRISGPFVHENLALYVVDDPNAKSAGEIITLTEGLSSGQIKVTEKKDAQVNELLIENRSDKPCFVQAGDVVKGGQQDRLIGRDFVIPPKTSPTPVSSFCVEHSRWNGVAAFTATTQNAYSRELKLAVQKDASQQKVWEEVEGKKKAVVLTAGITGVFKSSSLNEELENPKVQEKLKASRAALGRILEDHPRAVGLVWAINGKFSTADLYDDPSLFRKMFPRLVDSATMEALTVKSEAMAAPPAADASSFLTEAEKGQKKNDEARPGLKLVTCENEKSVQFDYAWESHRVHRQVVSK
jgi:hypothetical protein